MTVSEDELLPFYQRELAYLRHMGAAFARRFDKVAGRLEVGPEQGRDPHVERLIESFALLTGRVQYNLDAEFPLITAGLLGILYPQFLDPVPSMTIARFDADPARVKLTSGYTVPKGTPLFAEGEDGSVCRMRTCYPVTLWPVAVTGADVATPDQLDVEVPDAVAVLRIRLASLGAPLHTFDLGTLRLFVRADPILSARLYELLTCQVRWIGVRTPGSGPVRRLRRGAVAPVGFAADEDVLPYPPHAQPAYRLLQEYLEFADKFLFLDVTGLDTAGLDREAELVFALNRTPPRQLEVDRDTFVPGCAPVINLFTRPSEPIRLTQRRTEYRLVADLRHERTTEVHSVRSVSASPLPGEGSAVVAPFFSFDHAHTERAPSVYWLSRRETTGRADLPGTDVWLSFVDLDLKPAVPPERTVYAHVLCTNRSLAEQLPAGARLQVEQPLPVHAISCLRKPTPQRTPILGGSTAWKLVSQLSLNHLSLAGGEVALQALREIVRLHGGNPNAQVDRQLLALRSMTSRPVVQRIGADAWRGFVRGTEITLEIDERAFAGGNPMLFAAVLNHFFALYASVNAFTQLVVTSTQRPEVWKQWPPMIGYQPVL
jgi:type VI secretion system protein ImpG